jgi:hypothetical protein
MLTLKLGRGGRRVLVVGQQEASDAPSLAQAAHIRLDFDTFGIQARP